MSGKHSAESRATNRLVRATYILAIATLALVLVTALLVFKTAEESHHKNDCPPAAIVNERKE